MNAISRLAVAAAILMVLGTASCSGDDSDPLSIGELEVEVESLCDAFVADSVGVLEASRERMQEVMEEGGALLGEDDQLQRLDGERDRFLADFLSDLESLDLSDRQDEWNDAIAELRGSIAAIEADGLPGALATAGDEPPAILSDSGLTACFERFVEATV